jgi:hypothetical protein
MSPRTVLVSVIAVVLAAATVAKSETRQRRPAPI